MAIMRHVETANDIIDTLGGTSAVAKMLKRSPQQVSNWRADGRLPSSVYLLVSNELAKYGKVASPRLFGISEPAAM